MALARCALGGSCSTMVWLLVVVSLQVAEHLPLAAGQIAPDYLQKQTVFHINPLSAGTVPLNQNTGDIRGDLSFYLDQFLLPLECANGSDTRTRLDCGNTERSAADIVATQVDLEIDNRFTHYSACNLCNGTDPFFGRPCKGKPGEYTCDCFSPWGRLACNPGRVGRENVSVALAPPIPSSRCKAALHRSCSSAEQSKDGCLKCLEHNLLPLKFAGCSVKTMIFFCGAALGMGCAGPESPPWACWRMNLARKTGGNWFSTLQDGMCGDGSATDTCGWRVVGSRTINETCLRNTLATSIEEWNAECFHACGPRNETSECWITCAMEGLMGPDAGRSISEPLSGMPVSKLEDAWKKAFSLPSEGGCPTVDMRAADMAISERERPQRDIVV